MEPISQIISQIRKSERRIQTSFPSGYSTGLCTGDKKQKRRYIPVLYNASVYKDDLNNVIGVFASARDITELKEAEKTLNLRLEELTRSNKELEQFAYISSHDLQEPLRMIASYLQLLERKYKGKLDFKADKYIKFSVDGATRMQNLIDDLLTFQE